MPSAAPAVQARTGWIALRSPNFYVIGDVGAGDLRLVTKRLEQFREAIAILFPNAPLSTATPTTVLVFKSHKSYQPLKPLYNGKVKAQIAGYFQATRAVNYVTFTLADGIDQLDIVYHEYVHLIVNNTMDNVPVWFNEGLAEYYRTFTASDNGRQAVIGMINPYHVLLLRQQALPLADLVRVDHSSPLYNEGNKASIFYAESWALVHYLLLGENQQYAKHTAELVGDQATGVPFETACVKRLGIDLPTLEKQLRRYVQRELFVSEQLKFSDRIGRIDQLPVAPVAEAEVHATMGDLLLSMQRPDEARAELDAALALDDSFGPAQASLGRLDMDAKQWDQARAHLEKAIASPNATYFCHYAYAEAMTAYPQMAGTSSGDGKANPAIDKALRRAIELNPAFVDSYGLLAWHLQATGGDLNEAEQLIVKALALSPGHPQYALTLAGILSSKQDFARSLAVLDQIIAHGSDDGVREQARQMRTHINDFLKQKAEWEANRTGRDDSKAPPSSLDGSPGASSGEGRLSLDLRKLGAGESRLAGTLVAIECVPKKPIVLVVRVDGGTIRAHAAKFDEIDFISYRNDLKGQIQCGARTPADPVLLTIRPDANSTSTGAAVAVEFVPANYKP